jgi:hypothetical protein
MIIGNVNANREAIVQLVVLGSQQQQQEIQVVIDHYISWSDLVRPSRWYFGRW